jgi:hypothetical protein
MSLAELMPLVESLSQADRQQLMSFLSIQQPEIVVGQSIADHYEMYSDNPIAKVVDLNGFSGVIQLESDALEMQLKMRNEWT